MTLIIVTGEIDLSVASVVGLSSVLVGVSSTRLVVAGGLGAARGSGLRRPQWFPDRLRRIPVACGDHRHARPVSGYRRGAARHEGSHRLPGAVDRPRHGGDRRGRASGHDGRSPCSPVFTLLLHFSTFGRGVFDIGMNAEAAHFSGVSGERTKFVLFPLSGPGLRVRRDLLHAAVRQQSRRQRDRPRAPGDRGRPAGRCLDLRWPRQAPGRHRGCTADRGPLERAAAGGHHGQRHQHHHWRAADRLRDVHECPGRSRT